MGNPTPYFSLNNVTISKKWVQPPQSLKVVPTVAAESFEPTKAVTCTANHLHKHNFFPFFFFFLALHNFLINSIISPVIPNNYRTQNIHQLDTPRTCSIKISTKKKHQLSHSIIQLVIINTKPNTNFSHYTMITLKKKKKKQLFLSS